VEGIGHLLFDEIVYTVDLLPDALEVEPAVHHLDAKVVLFVDHQAVPFVSIDGHGAGTGTFGVLAADEVPFDKELAVELGQRFHVDIEKLLAFL
jgi:hypothetical protein